MLQGQGGVNKVTLLAAYNAFAKYADCHELLRPDLISTQGPKLFEAEFGAASRIDFGGAHAGRIVGRA